MSAKATVQNVDLLTLEGQVCFALAIANRGVLAVCRPLLKPLRLTHPQYLVMHAPLGSPEIQPEPLSVKQITAAPQLDSATLSPMLKRLEVPGPITRSRGTTDERTARVELTADGFAPPCAARRSRFRPPSSSASAATSTNGSGCPRCSPG